MIDFILVLTVINVVFVTYLAGRSFMTSSRMETAWDKGSTISNEEYVSLGKQRVRDFICVIVGYVLGIALPMLLQHLDPAAHALSVVLMILTSVGFVAVSIRAQVFNSRIFEAQLKRRFGDDV